MLIPDDSFVIWYDETKNSNGWCCVGKHLLNSPEVERFIGRGPSMVHAREEYKDKLNGK